MVSLYLPLVGLAALMVIGWWRITHAPSEANRLALQRFFTRLIVGYAIAFSIGTFLFIRMHH